MAISKNDLVITVSMLVALIVVNVIVVEAGLASSEVTENEIPELNLSTDSFDLVGDRPDKPSGPDQFRIRDDGTAIDRQHSLNTTHYSKAFNNPSDCSISINDESSILVTGTETDNGSRGFITAEEWRISYVLENNQTCQFFATIEESPSGGGGFLDSFIGGSAEAIQGVWNAISYLAATAIWIIGVILEMVFSFGLLVINIAGFGIGFLSWAFGTYVALTSSAGSWASLALTVPVVGLSVMFMKIGVSIISASNWL